MRIEPVFRHLAVMLAALAFTMNAGAQSTGALDPKEPVQFRYGCGYLIAPDGLWWIRCIDLELAAGALLPASSAARPPVWNIPVYAPPFSDTDSLALVRAVLCSQRPCTLSLSASAR